MWTNHVRYVHCFRTEKERQTEKQPQKQGQMPHQVFLSRRKRKANSGPKNNSNKV